MNNTLNSSFETNFNVAMKMSECNYDYQELITFLSSDKIVEKQIAILNLDEIKSKDDAKLLVSNLVGQDGKIREVVAFKLNQLIKNAEYTDFLIDEEIFAVLMQGIMDINGNVCRQIVDIASFLHSNNEFREYFCGMLPEMISKNLVEIEKIEANSKQYVISKRNFQLYWCLEALYDFVESIDFNTVKEILLKTGVFYDYTIREKTAKILTRINNSELNSLKEGLKNDENYYVRRYLG